MIGTSDSRAFKNAESWFHWASFDNDRYRRFRLFAKVNGATAKRFRESDPKVMYPISKSDTIIDEDPAVPDWRRPTLRPIEQFTCSARHAVAYMAADAPSDRLWCPSRTRQSRFSTPKLSNPIEHGGLLNIAIYWMWLSTARSIEQDDPFEHCLQHSPHYESISACKSETLEGMKRSSYWCHKAHN